jgi:hypothetical protein
MMLVSIRHFVDLFCKIPLYAVEVGQDSGAPTLDPACPVALVSVHQVMTRSESPIWLDSTP